jgi:hypothetical protein
MSFPAARNASCDRATIWVGGSWAGVTTDMVANNASPSAAVVIFVFTCFLLYRL